MAMYDGAVSAHFPQQPFWGPQPDELWEEGRLTQELFTSLNAGFVPQQYSHQTYQPWLSPGVPDEFSIDVPYQSPVGVYHSSYLIQEPVRYSFGVPQRCTSPNPVVPPPLSPDNSWSGSQSGTCSPASSPSYSSEMASHFSACVSFHGSSGIKQPHVGTGAPCVALIDVQQYADAQSDEDAPFEEDSIPFSSAAAPETFSSPVTMVNATDADAPLDDDRLDSGAEQTVPTPTFRRRHTHGTSRGSKRSRGKTRMLARQAKTRTENSNAYHVASARRDRAFPCALAPYGCRASFGSKNEWKRHINTQHMRLGFWRCDQCDLGATKTNDFNRKDLFIQHLRRMHNPKAEQSKSSGGGGRTAKAKGGRKGGKPSKHDPDEQALIATANRCFHRTRDAPRHTACFFCADIFTGASGWEERLEHIGKHMESARRDHHIPMDPYCWHEDADLEQWLLGKKIIIEGANGCVLTEGAS